MTTISSRRLLKPPVHARFKVKATFPPACNLNNYSVHCSTDLHHAGNPEVKRPLWQACHPPFASWWGEQ
eukprot:4894147-Pyramimonas_sp.AAC.1